MNITKSNRRDYNQDPFTKLMFGTHNKQRSAKKSENIIERYIENVDLDGILESIDSIITTSQQLKPYLSKISPIILKFISKK